MMGRKGEAAQTAGRKRRAGRTSADPQINGTGVRASELEVAGRHNKRGGERRGGEGVRGQEPRVGGTTLNLAPVDIDGPRGKQRKRIVKWKTGR